jgi:hypothetical protein
VTAKKSATFCHIFAAVLVYISSFLELHVLHVLWVKNHLQKFTHFAMSSLTDGPSRCGQSSMWRHITYFSEQNILKNYFLCKLQYAQERHTNLFLIGRASSKESPWSFFSVVILWLVALFISTLPRRQTGHAEPGRNVQLSILNTISSYIWIQKSFIFPCSKKVIL